MAAFTTPSFVHQFIRFVLSPVETARHYTLEKFRGDLLAGLTVGAVAVPQSMAYAIIAGVPPVYGLYTMIIQGVITGLFTSSRFASAGPINTQSLLAGSIAVRIVDPGNVELYVSYVILLTFVKGVMQLAFAFAGLASLVRYVSRSVIIGFTGGAGVLIAAGQIANFLGYSAPKSAEAWPGLPGIIQQLLPGLHQTDWRSVLIGTGVVVLILIGKRISPLLPAPLIGVILSAVVVWAMGWLGEVLTIRPLPQGLPAFMIPDFGLLDAQQMEAILGGALALSLLGLMEVYAISKSLGGRVGDRVSGHRELVVQGMTNTVSSFFQCIPGSASFSRSALNFQAGAQTQFSGVIAAVFVAVVFLSLAPLARYVPMSSLAAVLFVVALGLIDWRFFLRMRQASRTDAAVYLATFIATLLLPLQYAVYIGIFLNIALYLRKASRLHMAEMVQDETGGQFSERPLMDRMGNRQVIFLQLEGDLFFGVADELQDRLNFIAGGPVRVVILRMKRTHMIDATVLGVLEQFIKDMRKRDRHVLFCGIRPELMQSLAAYGLVELAGKENVFAANRDVYSSAKQALARAQELVGASIDAGSIDVTEDEWAYEI